VIKGKSDTMDEERFLEIDGRMALEVIALIARALPHTILGSTGSVSLLSAGVHWALMVWLFIFAAFMWQHADREGRRYVD